MQPFAGGTRRGGCPGHTHTHTRTQTHIRTYPPPLPSRRSNNNLGPDGVAALAPPLAGLTGLTTLSLGWAAPLPREVGGKAFRRGEARLQGGARARCSALPPPPPLPQWRTSRDLALRPVRHGGLGQVSRCGRGPSPGTGLGPQTVSSRFKLVPSDANRFQRMGPAQGGKGAGFNIGGGARGGRRGSAPIRRGSRPSSAGGGHCGAGWGAGG